MTTTILSPSTTTDLIFDDGVPLETHRHRQAMNTLIRSVSQLMPERNDYFAGGNMFLYYSPRQVRNQDFRGPDFFVVLEVENRDRRGWVVWEEDGRYPNVIVELMSPSTASVDLEDKYLLYEQTFGTQNYYVFDPFAPESLRGWRLEVDRYQELNPNEQGWLWCEELHCWLGVWTGTVEGVTTQWLRFFTPTGELVPLPEEAAQAQAEQAQALALAEQIKAQQAQAQAEQAQAQAEQAQAQAEQAQALAEQAQAQAEQAQALAQAEQTKAQQAQAQAEQAQAQALAEQAKAQQAQALAERLAARLRELGIDPEVV